MQAEIVNRSAGWVLGVESRIVPGKADYKGLWESGFVPRHEEIQSSSVDGAYYGVYYPCSESGKVDFVAGMMIGAQMQPSQGLVMRPVPGGLYASVQCAMSSIGQTWDSIYGHLLPSSEYEEDETRPAIEYYPPEMIGADSNVTIFVAIKPKL